MSLASPTTLLSPISKPKLQHHPASAAALHQHAPPQPPQQHKQQEPVLVRRHLLSTAISAACATSWLAASSAAMAASDEEYVKDTEEVISKVRTTITLDRNAPNVADAVADMRETSNFWVAKYRKEKALLARASFRDMYSALNAVSGHYISFGPTAPLPAKRKARILEEMDTAEKALLRGR